MLCFCWISICCRAKAVSKNDAMVMLRKMVEGGRNSYSLLGQKISPTL